MVLQMNTREFEIKKLSATEMRAKFDELSKSKFESLSEEKTDKYDMRTYWLNKRPAYKYYRYKSWTAYLHDFLNQINYQYIPA